MRHTEGTSSEHTGRSRYPGTRPFSDSAGDSSRFFGRSDEGEELLLRLLSVPLLVQFGRSGLGKTSLLQAWLFPRLREKLFLPVMIRLNGANEGFTAAVARAIHEASEAAGVEHSEARTEGLWELLSTTTIWRGDLLLTPVLVFDQFEEVFTLHDEAYRSEVARELGAVASGIPPDRGHANGRTGSERLATLPNLKIVLSLREDCLGALEQFSAAIPCLFQERIRLEPFKEHAAREAISEPAQLTAQPGEEAYWAPSFTFAPAALEQIIGYLKGGSDVIEPFQLQVICRHAEAIARRKAVNRSDPITLTVADFAGPDAFASILSHFYRDTIRKLPRAHRKNAERLCEEGLVGASGHRLMLEEKQIRDQFRIEPQVLAVLARERLIRRERRLDSAFYEISHDRLAESIFSRRRFRIPASAKRLLWAASFVALAVTAGFVWAVVARGQAETARTEAEAARADAQELVEFMLFNLRDELQKIHRLDLLEETTERTLNYLNRQVDTESPSVARSRSVAFTTMGDLELSRGNAGEALHEYRHALEIDQTLLATDPSGITPQWDVAISYSRVGDALLKLEDLEAALDAYISANESWTMLARQEPSHAQWQRELATTHLSIGDVHAENHNAAGAVQSFRQALAIGQELVAVDANDLESRSLVISAHLRIGDVLTAARDGTGALVSYKGALKHAEALLDLDPESLEQKNTLSWSLVLLARAQVAVRDQLGARRALERALSIMAPVVQTNRSDHYLDTYAQALLMLGRNSEAKPVVQELLARGWKDETFLDLARRAELH